MLENSLINQEDSVEKYFCKEFDKLPVVPMTNEQTEIFMKLILSEDGSIPEEIEQESGFQILKKRFEHALTIKPDNRTIFWFWYISEGNPGDCIMYAVYLQYKCKQMNMKNLKFEDIARIYPDGFPTKQSMKNMWDNQKVNTGEQKGVLDFPSDNLIDYILPCKSILF